MKYIQFFEGSATKPHRLEEACGDRGVVLLDGRERNVSHHKIARDECDTRGYLAYQLRRGSDFTHAQAYSPITVRYL